MPIYMKIDGIPGGSQSENHRDWLDLFSFSWGETNAGGGGGGGGAGRVQMQDFAVVKPSGRGTPRLFHACASGRMFREVLVDVTRIVNERDELYMQFKLTDCRLSSYQVGCDTASEPSENVAVNFAKMEYTYIVFDEAGQVRETQMNWWDQRANRGG